MKVLEVLDRSQCVWSFLFNLHCSRIPESGRFGRWERESRAECNAGVGQGSCRNQRYPSAAGEAVSAWPSAFLLLRRIYNSVWSHQKLWVFSCILFLIFLIPPLIQLTSSSFMPFTWISLWHKQAIRDSNPRKPYWLYWNSEEICDCRTNNKKLLAGNKKDDSFFFAKRIPHKTSGVYLQGLLEFSIRLLPCHHLSISLTLLGF